MTVEVLKILEEYDALCRDGQSAVLASVVRVEGSTYRRPGARALISPGGDIIGLIGGGCLEADLLRRAQEVCKTRRATTVHYDNSSPDDIVWGLGLGCAGKVDVLLEPVDRDHPGPLEAVAQTVARRRPAVMATVIRHAGEETLGARQVYDVEQNEIHGHWPLALDLDAVVSRVRTSGKPDIVEDGESSVLVEALQVPVRLLVVGAGADAVPLVELASALGWLTDVVDHRPAFAKRERFPRAQSVSLSPVAEIASASGLDSRSAAVLMTHNYLNDQEILAGLMSSEAAYLGVLGPKARLEMLLRDLQGQGIEPSPKQRARLRGPVGLDLGAESPEEIALAIVSEIKAHFSGRDPIPLAAKEGAIH